MKKYDQIDGSKLKEAIGILNESGLLDAPIRIVGVKKPDLVTAFAEAYEGLDAEAEKTMIDEKKYGPVIALYTDIFGDEINEDEEPEEGAEEEEDEEEESEEPEEEEEESDDEPEEEKPAKKEKKGKKEKEKPAKKEKAAPAPEKEKKKDKKEPAKKEKKAPAKSSEGRQVGQYEGSQAEKIDKILAGKGASIADMAEAAGATVARVNRRLNKLKKQGKKIIEEKGIFKLAKEK